MSLLQFFILHCLLLSSTTLGSQCNEAEISTLLAFTSSFHLFCDVYPNITSWNTSVLEADYWDGVGVHCDPITGDVIGIDLGSSCLYGPINSNSSIFSLLHLHYLNLSHNNFFDSTISYEFGKLSMLEYLDLSSSGFVGAIPSEISKLSKLTLLDLSVNDLQGEFPTRIFHLPNLQRLSIQENNALQGYLPDFNSCSRLETLQLYGTKFAGKIPASVGNLVSLKTFDLSFCKFVGTLPSSLGNLTQLIYLHLADNNFIGSSLTWLSKLTKLKYVYLFDIHLEGEIPSSLANLTQLSVLYMYDNTLHGAIPSWLGNLTQLYDLNLASNSLSGSIPNSLLNLHNITSLLLDDNHLSGPLELDVFFQLENLSLLSVNGNHLTITSNNSVFERSSLLNLDISFNKLHGSFPIPPPSLQIYAASNIELIGQVLLEVPTTICSLSSLIVLYFRNSHLTGELPQCFGSLSEKLQVLDLRSNAFHGSIPQLCLNGDNRILKSISLNDNGFEGQLPRSLANCSNLEFLDVGNNLINDTFPSWLGSLLHLQVVVLKANAFYGSIGIPNNNAKFPGLRVIDISMNKFSGNLLSTFLQALDAMKSSNLSSSSDKGVMEWASSSGSYIYYYSTTIFDKGMELEYVKFSDALIAIDLSHNRFHGRIPRILGDLRGLHLLNLSYNCLTGPIPSSFAKLKELQSFDLSTNKLSGDIPPQLTQLTFVSIFNVSYNHLTGYIPQGGQFSTFEENSYLGNSGLCGKPLSRSCHHSDHVNPPPDQMKKQEKKLVDTMKVIGFVCGSVLGVAIENAVDWRRLIQSCIWMLRWRFRRN